MIKTNKIKYLSILCLAFIFIGCKENKKLVLTDTSVFEKTNWMVDSRGFPDSVKLFFTDYIISIYKNQLLNNWQAFERYKIVGDTLILFNYDEDTLKANTSIVFIGLVKKCDKDSLVIESVYGDFPFDLSIYKKINLKKSIYRFFNDELNADPNYKFEKLCFTSTGCYGRCPETIIELNNRRELLYLGGTFAKPLGNKTGKCSERLYKKIVSILSKAKFESDSIVTRLAIDAPVYQFLIYANSKRTYLEATSFPRRLRPLPYFLFEVADSTKWVDSKTIPKYEITFGGSLEIMNFKLPKK